MKKDNRYYDAVKAIALSSMLYEPDTGLLRWMPDKKFIKKNDGEPLGCSDGQKGYLLVYITACGKSRGIRAHRLAWLLHYGDWPDGQIDHINHVRTDNRICNLRSVCHVENHKNRSLRKDNTSGYSGVSYSSRQDRWIGSFQADGKKIHVGRFRTADEAGAAVRSAILAAGLHENHGL